MSSLYSTFSALRCSVASPTDLSKDLMPASRAFSSSPRAARPSSAEAMAASSSEMARSKALSLSSVMSNCVLQYSFLLSSSTCSFLSISTMSSHILMTFSKPLVEPLPLRERARRSKEVRCSRGTCLWATRMALRAAVLWLLVAEVSCIRLVSGEGRVFLKRSSASSSLRTLMVSLRATSSSARNFCRSSHSLAFVPQLFSNSAKYS
mmetsp:Transcript_52869/g.112860  ORF Transcript_52869/g.112860 Transcript_52869/m.112860 type:complete len:207 (-) Transcript_52869:932-1552(-)